MPIIKSAKKQMRQNVKHRQRNYMMRSKLRTYMKKALLSIKGGDVDEAAKAVQMAYSTIDTAVKKKIVHKNNAARKKSGLARMLNNLQSGGNKTIEEKKPAAKKIEKSAE